MELSPGEVGDEDKETGEEGIGSTLESSCHDLNEGDGGTGVMTLRTIEVENNQMGKLMVNPGKDNVAIYGAPAFPNGGNEPGVPSGRRPWLVGSSKFSIQNEPEKHLHYNQEYFLGSTFLWHRNKT